MVGSEPYGATKRRMAMWRIDSGGGLVFKQTWSDFTPSEGLSVAASKEGGLQIGGRSFLNVGDLRLMHTNEFGQLDYAYNYGSGGLQQAQGIGLLPDGGMYVVGVDNYGGSGGRDGWLIRFDAWGNYSCYDAGGCADTSLYDCVDNNPCTRDFCTSKKGCHHPLQANYTPCGGKKFCGFGECKGN